MLGDFVKTAGRRLSVLDEVRLCVHHLNAECSLKLVFFARLIPQQILSEVIAWNTREVNEVQISETESLECQWNYSDKGLSQRMLWLYCDCL